MEGTRIVLVRHGESRAQELGILGGHDGCQGLSDRGRRQVAALRDRLAAARGAGGDDRAVLVGHAARGRDGGDPRAGARAASRCGPSATSARATPARPTGSPGTELAERFPSPDGWDPDHSPVRRLGDLARDGRAGAASARRRSSSATRARRSSWRATAGVVVQAMLHWLVARRGRRRRAGRGSTAENTSLTEWRFAPNPYQKHMLPVQLVRFNDHAHLGAARASGAAPAAGSTSGRRRRSARAGAWRGRSRSRASATSRRTPTARRRRRGSAAMKIGAARRSSHVRTKPDDAA